MPPPIMLVVVLNSVLLFEVRNSKFGCFRNLEQHFRDPSAGRLRPMGKGQTQVNETRWSITHLRYGVE